MFRNLHLVLKKTIIDLIANCLIYQEYWTTALASGLETADMYSHKWMQIIYRIIAV